MNVVTNDYKETTESCPHCGRPIQIRWVPLLTGPHDFYDAVHVDPRADCGIGQHLLHIGFGTRHFPLEQP
jgi:hypothetical protein